jgi:ABC-type transporter Mla subunit MlaD
MTPEDPAHKLSRLQEASERAAANLLELEIDSSRQLLEVSALTGRSADRWSHASGALTDLWRWQGLLTQVLERAEKPRGPWRTNDLRALVEEESIELTRSEIPLAERDLLGSAERTVRCTPDQLLERMSRAFDEVKTVVAGFGEAWDALAPRVKTAQTTLEQAQTLADGLGERERVDEAARAVARLAASASADPLSTRPEDVDRVIDSLQDIRGDLEATAALRRDFDGMLAGARRLLSDLEMTVRAGLAVHERLQAKISVPTPPAPLAPPNDLSAALDAIAGLARSGSWRDARHRLDAWTSRTRALLDDAQQALRANRAPIEARDQLRALLEAYQVKAERLGLVEDPELERIFTRAHEELYTAPTDLALVSQLVRSYQERLAAARPEQETVR